MTNTKIYLYRYKNATIWASVKYPLINASIFF